MARTSAIQTIYTEEELEEIGLPTVKGHLLSKEEMEAFLMFIENIPFVDIAKKVGKTRVTISNWAHTDWWKELLREFEVEKMQGFRVRVHDMLDHIADGLEDVAKDTDVRTAMARVQLGKHVMEMGAEPMIDKRPRPVTVGVGINLGNIDRTALRQQSDDDLLAIASSGKVPDNLIIKEA